MERSKSIVDNVNVLLNSLLEDKDAFSPSMVHTLGYHLRHLLDVIGTDSLEKKLLFDHLHRTSIGFQSKCREQQFFYTIQQGNSSEKSFMPMVLMFQKSR